MNLVIYSFQRIGFRIRAFFEHWYIDTFHLFKNKAINSLRTFNRIISLRVNVRYIFTPLYQDNSFIGYFFGFFVRLFNIIISSVINAVIILFYAGLYILWALIPIYIIYRIIIG